MDYRTPEGNILRTSRTRAITVHLEGHDEPGVFPSTILDKQSPAVLDKYGYRRMIYGTMPDAAYWKPVESSDLSTPGLEVVSYTAQPRYTADQIATAMMEKYEAVAGPVVEKIRTKLAFYAAIGRAAEEATWQALYDQVRPKYMEAVAAYQAAASIQDEAEKYQAFIDLYNFLGDYTVQLPE
jgi:hypothetical protein